MKPNTELLLKSDGVELLKPAGTIHHPGLLIVQSTRNGGASPGNFGMNISSRVGDDAERVGVNRERFFRACGIPDRMVATAGQVHGTTVRRVNGEGHFEETDGLFTNRRGLFLTVTVADCLPIYFFDAVRRGIGIVHAGWRGTLGGIARSCIEQMEQVLSTSPEDLHVYIGPGAGRCCYEVGQDVADRFPGEYLHEHDHGRYLLDLPLFNRHLLLKAGVLERQTSTSTHCTIHEKDIFHSYRRDGSESGRMMGVIGLR